jgi:hypothetical protein
MGPMSRVSHSLANFVTGKHPAMADAGDFDSIVVFEIEEHAVVAAAETEADERGL